MANLWVQSTLAWLCGTHARRCMEHLRGLCGCTFATVVVATGQGLDGSKRSLQHGLVKTQGHSHKLGGTCGSI